MREMTDPTDREALEGMDEERTERNLRRYTLAFTSFPISIICMVMGYEDRSWPISAVGIGIFGFAFGYVLGWRARGNS
jgi:hypothetical protein